MAIFAPRPQGPRTLTGVESNWFAGVADVTSSGVLVVAPYTASYDGTPPYDVTLTASLINNGGQVVTAGVPLVSYRTGYNFQIGMANLANGDTAVLYDVQNASNPSTGVDIKVQLVDALGHAVGGPSTLATNLIDVLQFRVSSIASGGASYDLTYATAVGGTETVYSQAFDQSGQPISGANVIDSFSYSGQGEGFGFGGLALSTSASPSYIYMRGSSLGGSGGNIGLKYKLVGVDGKATTTSATLEPVYPTASTANSLVSYGFSNLAAANSSAPNLAVVMRYSWVVGGVTSEALDVRTLNGTTGSVSSDVTIPVPVSSAGEGVTALANGDFVVAYQGAAGPTLQAFDARGDEIGAPYSLPAGEAKFNSARRPDGGFLAVFPVAASGGNQLQYDVYAAGDLMAARDMNSDATSDILWRDSSTGATESWLTQASGGFAYADDGAVSLNWQIQGTGDFDGNNRADILWRNLSNGDAYLYLSKPAGGFAYADLGVVSTDWQVAGVADFSGDGLADILWRNATTGADELWLTNRSGGFSYADAGAVPTHWQVAAAADFNGDGLADILWRDSTSGAVETWFTKAAGGYSYADDGTVSTDWRVAGAGDFNTDGAADILWRNSVSGDAYLYLSNGSGGFAYRDLGVVSTDWQIAQVGDFNGDGAADILWRNSVTGDNEFWETKGGGFTFASAGHVATNWKVAA